MKNFTTWLQISLFPLMIIAAWFYYPYSENGSTLCIWKRFFDVSCPGCGMTRAVCALAHGNIREALSYNIAVIAVVAGVALISLSGLRDSLKTGLKEHKKLNMPGKKA